MTLTSAVQGWAAGLWRGLTRGVQTVAQNISEAGSNMMGTSKPLWPPVEHAPRLITAARNEKLYRGQHREILTLMPGFQPEDRQAAYIATNWLGMMTDTIVGRAFGEGVTWAAPQNMEANTAFLAWVSATSGLPAVVQSGAVGASWAGDDVLKVTYDADRAQIAIVRHPASIVFPETDPLDASRLVAANVDRLLKVNEIGKATPAVYLWRERHELRDGLSWVLNKLYKLSEGRAANTYHFDPIDDEVPLETLPFTAGLTPEADTGISDLLLVWVSNSYNRVQGQLYGAPDYTDALVSLQAEVNHRLSHRGALLNKYLPPWLAGPAPSADTIGEGDVDLSRQRYIVVGQDETMPVSLLQWDANVLNVIDAEVAALKTEFALSAGIDQAALFAEQAGAVSGVALRRQQMRTQNGALARQSLWGEALQKVAVICTNLALSHPIAWQPEQGRLEPLSAEDVTVTFGDGLPPDRMEQLAEWEMMLNLGLATKAEARAQVIGETVQAAEQAVALAAQETNANRAGVPGLSSMIRPIAAGIGTPQAE